MNPFKYGSIVLGNDFCGRKDLLKQIAAHMEASQNILFKSGKEIRFVNPFFKAWLIPRGR